MKRRRLIIRSAILLVMVIAVGYTLYNQFSEERGVVDTGDIAPNFVLEDMEGNRLELNELRGEGVYVNFWATYCTYCREKMSYFEEFYEEYAEKGVKIVSVNVDETTLQVERHKDRQGLSYPLYIDRNMLVSNAYGVHSLPAAFLIDEDGEVIERQVGAQTKEEVLAALDELIPES
ncbi:thiol-disulfide oxidoreductase ResA [Salipaludibacillus agaradhaerens]|uniref:Thiol-disulfide oxidoreductase ResA n=1 Tax=Salipaludibacillus agaradhaerens TaxID=76935 RepID=A0A9Q4B1P1_SALAG|nr:thiol-disulfide oxidoreductase ResA [Salipaludibacillus agaradhaerens]MCR6096566.1 thiol-disulfide oxidoreductase ResA [Salipaludibacillus agaradhaerens]MCR6113875.1 thiol-disulfide oxidoreductase ResA [Salipaludibacillus agaradhaerens]